MMSGFDMTPRTLKLVVLFTALTLAGWQVPVAAAQQPAPLPIQDAQVIPLWTGAAPGALEGTSR
jgi:hypothetical protein